MAQQTMKDILNRMLNHEELSREEMKNILIGITQSEPSTSYSASVTVSWRQVYQQFSTLTAMSTLWVLVVTVRIPLISRPQLVS